MNSLLSSFVADLGNRLLRQDPDTLDRLAALEGRVIAVVLRDMSLRFYIRPFGGGLRISDHHEGDADVTLTGSIPGFLRLAARRGDSSALFDGDVVLAGDSRLAQRFQRVLARLEIDWERWIARYTGDVVGSQFAGMLRHVGGWMGNSVDTMARDSVEYWQHERHELVLPESATAHMDAVDDLRADLDRLEQRIRILAGRLQP